jgi:2-polyprenyl-3-methyl-5-hydroxy-6-metoxy-1,4-benzoquinol methylase
MENLGSSEQDRERWLKVKESFSGEKIELGPYFTHILRNSPRRLLHMLSYYKFAAKMIGKNQEILEIGCSEGLGTVVLAESSKRCLAVDIDHFAIESAQSNFTSPRLTFATKDILKGVLGEFDAVVNFDTIEHIEPGMANEFLKAMVSNLKPNGMMVLGTPSLTSDAYANPITRAGHINLYSAERLQENLSQFFHRVMIFSANDEVVHTGFAPLAHYLIAVGVHPKGLV